jgi:hypothetical protein
VNGREARSVESPSSPLRIHGLGTHSGVTLPLVAQGSGAATSRASYGTPQPAAKLGWNVLAVADGRHRHHLDRSGNRTPSSDRVGRPRAGHRRRARLDARRTSRWRARQDCGVVGGRSRQRQCEALQAALDASLRGWLENLKHTAERGAG